MPDTLTMDAPGTIADAEPEASGASLVETSLPAAVETDAAPDSTETESPELSPEELKAELAKLKKDMEGADYRKEQALKDQKAQLERDLREAAEAQAHKTRLERAQAVARGGFQAEMRKLISEVERGEHLDDNGQEKMLRLADGRILPYRDAWTAYHVDNLATAVGLGELETLADMTPAQMRRNLPEWQPDTGLMHALDVAKRNHDILGIWQAHYAIVEDGLLKDLSPKTRRIVEAELKAAGEAEAAAKGTEGAAKARETTPKPTNIAGAVAAANGAWRDASPLSKTYRDGYRAEYGTNPPGT